MALFFITNKWRVQAGLIQDRQDIVQGFPVRQIIIWQRAGGINFNRGYFLPTYEVIYMITKPDFKLVPKANAVGDIWVFPQEMNNKHPAPFPVNLIDRIISSTKAKVIIDPFMGSGTTAISAKKLKRNFIGIDISEEYCNLSKERLKSFEKTGLDPFQEQKEKIPTKIRQIYIVYIWRFIMKIYTKQDLINELKKIRIQGWIKNKRTANDGSVGNTLEDILGIEENNLPIPNAAEWELKCQRKRTTSPTTLFHCEPSPRALKFVTNILLPKYGWEHKKAGKKYPKTEMSFRQTISCINYSDRGFRVELDKKQKKIVISFNSKKQMIAVLCG